MTRGNTYEVALDRNNANFVPLSPLTFIRRSAYVYPEQIAIVYGDQQYTWKKTYARCHQLASALAGIGIGVGDTVAVILPNVPAMYEALRSAHGRRGAKFMLRERLKSASAIE